MVNTGSPLKVEVQPLTFDKAAGEMLVELLRNIFIRPAKAKSTCAFVEMTRFLLFIDR